MPTPTARAWSEARARDAALPRADRARHGVVHTPPTLARFVAAEALRLADALGLAGPFTLIDPAVGTGMFPAAAVEVGADRLGAILGLDLDPDALLRAGRALGGAPGLILREENALALDPFDLSAHASGALLVLGNPPWAQKSASRGTPLSDAMLELFRVEPATGAPIRERKIGVLSDDYVRFVRWALGAITSAPHGGVMGLVTNGSWLDGPVHRAMRASLISALDELIVVDLGGSALIARRRGVRDDNVFGVRPNVSILIGGRRPGSRGGARVSYARIEGSTDEKLAVLDPSLARTPLAPTAPSFALVPRAVRAPGYVRAPSLEEWLPFHREGLQTNRDAFAIDADRAALVTRLTSFVEGGVALPASAHFDPEAARVTLGRALENGLDGWIARVDYRPFDRRWYVRHPAVCHRPRPELAAAMERSAFALVTTRKDRGALPFRHLAVVRSIPDSSFLSARSACRSRALPTHYPDGAPNVGAEIADRLGALRGAPLAPDDVAAIVAAVLGAPRYQRAFDEALKSDLPRIPLPRSAAELEALIPAGRALVQAWLAPPPEPALHPRAETLTIGHLSVGAHPAASAIAAAEDLCDEAVAELLGATLRP